MKKVTTTNLSVLLVFVLASAVFSVSGNVFAQDNNGNGENNNNNNGESSSNVNQYTGTNTPQQDVAQNFTAFSNATTPQDVQQQQAPIEGSQANQSGSASSSGNATSSGANTTSQNATS
jgi:hypothetical protein